MTNEDAIKFANCLKNNYTIEFNDMADFCDMVIQALEIVEEFERAQIITGGRLNGRTYAYKCGLRDGKRKALEQQSSEDCVSRKQAIKTISTDIQLNLEGRTGLLKYSDEIKDILKTLLDSQEKKLKALPPVVPNNGTCKNCKKCDFEQSDQTYFCKPYGNLVSPSHYCKDFKKRGSEE